MEVNLHCCVEELLVLFAILWQIAQIAQYGLLSPSNLSQDGKERQQLLNTAAKVRLHGKQCQRRTSMWSQHAYTWLGLQGIDQALASARRSQA